MSDVPTWRLFAYMADDEAGLNDEHRRLADWQLPDALRWCTSRGFDHIYFSRDRVETSRFERGSSVPVVHHFSEERDAQSGDAA